MDAKVNKASAPPAVGILGSSPVALWGLTCTERLERLLARRTVRSVSHDLPDVSEGAVLLLRGDYVYDERVLSQLVDMDGEVLLTTEPGAKVVIAARVDASLAESAAGLMRGAVAADLDGLRRETPTSLGQGLPGRLRKAQAPFAIRVTEDRVAMLERLLYDASYKGVTDLVTKFLWPHPARHVVKLCTVLKLRPNHITAVGFTLMLLALWLFWEGRFGLGLLSGWAMTFLDTVDGKLARTTVTSSRFGHFFDHVMDIVHPPFWYIAWGHGLGETWNTPTPGISVEVALWAMFIGYLLGRGVEGLCSGFVLSKGIFVWRPFDSYFRLVTARRNPCMILLTAAWALGRPDLGLWLVCAWTVLTTLILMARLVMAWRHKAATGPLRSWLLDVDVATSGPVPRRVRWFGQVPRAPMPSDDVPVPSS